MIKENNKIFKNLYGEKDWRLKGSQARGIWDNTLKLLKLGKGKVFTDSVRLLYDQTLIIEGLKPDNPLDFAKRLNEVLNKSL